MQNQLDDLRQQLDRHLATVHEVDVNELKAYEGWRTDYQPFHWFAQFHEIMERGGFDVVLGNPPYIRRSKASQSYSLRDTVTIDCPDIYASVVERSINLLRPDGRIGMIVPLSLAFNMDFQSLREYLYGECDGLWFSHFGRRPSALFIPPKRVRNTIFLGRRSRKTKKRTFTTRLHRWATSRRPALFGELSYIPFRPAPFEGLIPKLGNIRLLSALEDLLEGVDYRLGHEFAPRGHGAELYFRAIAYNWLTFCVERPPVYDPDGEAVPPSGYGKLVFREKASRDLALVLGNGKLMFLWWCIVGDDFHLTKSVVESLPFGPKQLAEDKANEALGHVEELTAAMRNNLQFVSTVGKEFGSYNLGRCRGITDAIDKIWLEALKLADLWDDVELEHGLVVRTQGGDAHGE